MTILLIAATVAVSLMMLMAWLPELGSSQKTENKAR